MADPLARSATQTLAGCRGRAVGHLQRSGRHDPPIAELDDPVTARGVYVGMCHLDDGCAFAVEPLEQLHDRLALGGVWVAGRLVGQDQCRAGDDRAGDGDQLLLPA